MESQRLFVALEIPGPVRADLGEALEPWRQELRGARWVPPENWHVTLLFLGATVGDRVPWVRERLGVAAAGAAAFETSLTTLGGFPSAPYARIIWAGLDDRAGRIAELARAVGAAFDAEPEDRPFSAHVTVARSDPAHALPEPFIAIVLPAASFTVGELVLYRSHLGRPAPRYEPLARLPFGPRG